MGLERGKFTLLCNEKRNSTTYAWAQQRDRLYQWNVKNGVNETGNERREQKLRRERCERGCALFLLKSLSGVLARELDAGKKEEEILHGPAYPRDVLYVSVSWWANFIIHVTKNKVYDARGGEGCETTRGSSLRLIAFCGSYKFRGVDSHALLDFFFIIYS